MATTAAVSNNSPIKTVTVAGGNLFSLALKHLGDATQWNRIAALNGLSDPWLPPEIKTLRIPAVNLSATGGILGTK